MNWLRRLASNRLLDVGLAVVVATMLLKLVVLLPARAWDQDFAHYYLGSRMLIEGRDPYTTPLAPWCATRGFAYEPSVPIATNPPSLLWLLVPLACLPAGSAFGLWTLTQALALAAVLWFTQRWLGGRLTRRAWFFISLLAIGSAPVYWHFWFGQVQLLLVALVLAALWCQRANRHVTACVLVSVAGLLKLFPLALLPWFVWRAKGRRGACGATIAIVLASGVLATGPALWMGFAQHALPVVAQCAVNHSFNYTWPSFIANLGLASGGAVPVWQRTGVIIGALALAGSYVWVWRRGRDREAEFSLLSVAMLASGPTGWGYYFVFLIFPMAALAVRWADKGSAARVAALGVMLVCFNVMVTWEGPWLDRHLVLKVLANSAPLPALTLLGVLWGREIERQRDLRR